MMLQQQTSYSQLHGKQHEQLPAVAKAVPACMPCSHRCSHHSSEPQAHLQCLPLLDGCASRAHAALARGRPQEAAHAHTCLLLLTERERVDVQVLHIGDEAVHVALGAVDPV